jgi:hypothetical protein
MERNIQKRKVEEIKKGNKQAAKSATERNETEKGRKI